MLRPLAEIAPGLLIPGHGPIAALLAAVAGQRIDRLHAMKTGLDRFRHIAIEGPIGVGKSSLARRLATHLGAELMLEQPAENPFLPRFYADMPSYALQTQLFFLFQRLKQLQSLAQPSMFSSTIVSDFMFAKDALFARLTLSDDEHRLYTQMHAQIAPQLPEPDLVIWLQASAPTLLRRIRRRGTGMEQGIELGVPAAPLRRLRRTLPRLPGRAGVRGRHRALQPDRPRRRLRAAAGAARGLQGAARVLQLGRRDPAALIAARHAAARQLPRPRSTIAAVGRA